MSTLYPQDFVLLSSSYLRLGAGASEAAVVMELVSCSPFMTSWEGIRASLHDHRLHQNQGSWGVRMGSAPTVDHKHLEKQQGETQSWDLEKAYKLNTYPMVPWPVIISIQSLLVYLVVFPKVPCTIRDYNYWPKKYMFIYCALCTIDDFLSEISQPREEGGGDWDEGR